MTSIEEYAKERADIVYSKKPSKQKEEFIKHIIKKNMKWQKHEGGRLGESTATHSHHGFAIQSVLVPKDKFTRADAIKYIREHFEYKKIDSTQRKNFFSFRQIEPTPNSKYFTKVLDNGVELVFEKKPIGKDSIKPHFLPSSDSLRLSTDSKKLAKNVLGQPFREEESRGLSYDRQKVLGGSLKVNEIYQFISNGYDWPNIKPIQGYKYIKDLSTTFHQVYENKKDKRIILNYTGTKGIIDWLNNLDYILQTYTLWPKFQNAKAILDKVLKLYPNYKITLVSHSQGGIITREISRIYGDELFEIISLNPGGMSFIEAIKSTTGEGKRKKQNEYTIKSELDFASFFANPNENDVIITRESGDIVKEHSPNILIRLNPDLEIGRK
jgi:hypothetical protein